MEVAVMKDLSEMIEEEQFTLEKVAGEHLCGQITIIKNGPETVRASINLSGFL